MDISTINRARLSFEKLVVSGDLYEHFLYERPIVWNKNASARSCSRGTRSDAQRREDNLYSVRQQIRRLVECNNEKWGYPPVFLTFTFKENITDVTYANSIFHDFIRRLASEIRKRPRYLAIIEFQKRGAVHYHCVFFNLDIAIEQRERRERFIAHLWGAGFVDIERIRNARVASAYVCKYLDKAVHDKRLIGRKAFFTSRSLFRPRYYLSKKSIDEILGNITIKSSKVDCYESYYLGTIKKTTIQC